MKVGKGVRTLAEEKSRHWRPEARNEPGDGSTKPGRRDRMPTTNDGKLVSSPLWNSVSSTLFFWLFQHVCPHIHTRQSLATKASGRQWCLIQTIVLDHSCCFGSQIPPSDSLAFRLHGYTLFFATAGSFGSRNFCETLPYIFGLNSLF